MSLRRHKKIRNDPNCTLAKSRTRVSHVNVHGSIENPGWGSVVRKSKWGLSPSWYVIAPAGVHPR